MSARHKPRIWHTRHVHLWGCLWLTACLILASAVVLSL